MERIRPIAFYLPQFYPTIENDLWWGKGFTEWTNVAKARPLFPGHYQPRIPADLSFYDLRIPEVREQQAALARQAGVEGFCYWHYWFAGQRLLDRVFAEVVESGKPDFPFCLCWANHTWKKKTWDVSGSDVALMEQTYPGEEDYVAHFNAMLPAFKDKRYIKVDGKLLFGVFAAGDIPDTELFFTTWNRLAVENGLEGFCFFALSQGEKEYERCKNLGYDKIVYDSLNDSFSHIEDDKKIIRFKKRLKRKLLGYPYTVNYDNYIRRTIDTLKRNSSLTPCLDPDFDHSPRSGKKWIIVDGSTPQKWEQMCQSVMSVLMERCDDPGIIFIKSWNEWGEGNYLEPDLRFGSSYIEATSRAFRNEQ